MRLASVRTALWSEVRDVLLDMDGTILDKDFDDYFWLNLIPQRYAEQNGLTIEDAKRELFTRYKREERTLNWTDLDFWSRELDIDIAGLKLSVNHMVSVYPHVEEFLIRVSREKKRLFLVTNAHGKTIEIKMAKALLDGYFEDIINSFEMGCPKEDKGFWTKAQERIGFDNNSTLFIDDTIDVAMAAYKFGIRYVLLKTDKLNTSPLPSFSCYTELM